MAVLCSEIWLLIGVVFVLQLPVIRGQLCQQGWTFHAPTDSCMALIRENYEYYEARQYCEAYSSSTTKPQGHLVFIFDKATDDFVKGLLNKEHADTALIGLYDETENGDYVWGHDPPIPLNYTGWADNPHTPDFYKHHCVMTTDGWQEYDWYFPAYFVCQVNVDFTPPRMVCPVAEIGQESPDMTCTVDVRPSLTFTSLQLMQTADVVASCDARRCHPLTKYPNVVDVRKSQATRNSVSWSLKLRNVTISDQTDWACSVKYNNNGSWVASQPCSLKVYTKPADIQCSHKFVQAMVRTTCTAAKVYPEVGCTWEVKYGTRKLDVYNQTSSNDVVSAEWYYRATCNAEFSISNTGTYVVTVAMIPILPTIKFYTVKGTNVSVAPPQQPPQLYQAGHSLESLWVEVVENQTLNITCRVPGGDPEVYRTIIKCSNIQQPFESDGSSVTMDVRVTGEFDGQNCTCSALHAASYTQTSSVEIRVTSPPQQPPQLYQAGHRLESLWVEVVENQALNITCRVPGGDPEIYRTIITCNNLQQPFESDGSSVTMDVRVTRAFDGQNCTCSALHAASYTQTSSVEIRVTYPVTPVTSQAHDVGAIVIGIVSATVASIIFGVIILLWRKKGAPCKRTKHQNANTPMSAVDKIDDSGSSQAVEEMPQAHAPENPHYQELSDFRSDMADKPVEYANKILSNARDEEAEYTMTSSDV